MKSRPSDYFLGAILRGYRAEKASGKPVSASGIWGRICIEAIHRQGAFETLFAWDKSTAKSKNRIGTIRDCIKAGYVPGLELAEDERARAIVVEGGKIRE